MEKYQVCILMATHDGAAYLADQIESIQDQDYTNWKLYISDDCSHDETVTLIKRYAKHDSRIQLVSEGIRYGGSKENFMSLLPLAKGDYTMLSDQDDVWAKEKIRISLECIREEERVSSADVPLLVFSNMEVVNSNLEIIDRSFVRYGGLNPKRVEFEQVLAQSIGAGCTYLFNAALTKRVNQHNETTGYIMHDWWLALIASAFGKILYIDEPLSSYRQHDSNSIGAVRFNPIHWIGKFSEMTRRLEASVVQARTFQTIYGESLETSKAIHLNEYASIEQGDGLRNVRHLFESSVWKPGLRKLGQIIAAART